MQSSSLDLNGRVAVIIGATSGLGKEIAVGLAEHGAHVVPGGRRADLLRKVCDEIERVGRRTIHHPVDARLRDSLEAFRDSVLSTFGRVDILVNSAGRTFRKPSVAIGSEEWSSLFDTNLTAVLQSCQVFFEPLKASGVGRVINISSLSSYVAFHEVAAYCASKSAVLSLTRSLACEWAQYNICVNAIAPGVFPTELNESLLNGSERGREMLLRTPMRRFGHPRELVGAAVLLASDAASFITGQSIVVDGGYLASGVNS
jgi:NAD(P)-dependent dehydrogenase (short-subunit alcohol dehydrogenase family)